MKLTSMKRTKEERHKSTEAIPAVGTPEYSYGLLLRLESADLKKLGMKDLPDVDSVFTIEAKARVISAGERAEGTKAQQTLELQITDLGLRKKTVYEEMLEDD